MIYRKFSKNRGVILVDMLLALTLGAIFIALAFANVSSTRDTYDSAFSKNQLLGLYQNGQFRTTESLYGNDRVQLSDTVNLGSSTISFTRIASSTVDAAGTPLCSVNFGASNIVGSYRYSNVSSDIRATITPIRLPIDPNLPLTDLQVRNNTAYVSADSAVTSDPDILVFDIHDPQHSTTLAALSTGPGISRFTFVKNRIYAAAASTAAQLHVIRIDNLNLLTLEKKIRLPLPYATATPPLSSSIFYNDGRIYLGTEKWDGDEFNVFDISNPANPIKIGGLEIGSKVNDIFVNNGLAYVADADQNQLRLIDVHQSLPKILNAFSPSGWQRQEGETLSSFENTLQFGRTSGGFNISTDAELFAFASTSSTTLSAMKSIDIAGGVYGIVTDRSHVFAATRQLNKEFEIYDVSFNASTTYSLPVAPQRLTCDGDRLFILAETAPYIYEITFL